MKLAPSCPSHLPPTATLVNKLSHGHFCAVTHYFLLIIPTVFCTHSNAVRIRLHRQLSYVITAGGSKAASCGALLPSNGPLSTRTPSYQTVRSSGGRHCRCTAADRGRNQHALNYYQHFTPVEMRDVYAFGTTRLHSAIAQPRKHLRASRTPSAANSKTLPAYAPLFATGGKRVRSSVPAQEDLALI